MLRIALENLRVLRFRGVQISRKVRVKADIDPYSFL